MINTIVSLIALFGIAYAVFFAVVLGLVSVMPMLYRGLAIPAGIIAAAVVLYAAMESIQV